MRMFSERLQVLVSPEQRERLERLARQRHSSVGAVIREAVDAYTGPRDRTRAEAAEALFALDAPTGDWQAMKQEILRGTRR
jgi:predicted transcriptional regulator